jgi:drug/metabolite transporter (DMT)-like permease
MRNNVLVYLSIILAILFWSLSFVWYKTALLYFTPTGIITFRLTLASVALLAVGLLLGQVQRLRRADLRLFLTMAFFEPFVYSLCEANGLTMVSSTLAAVIVATIPLFTPLGAFVFLKERVSLRNTIGIGISVVGVVLVAYQTGSQARGSLLGILLMFGAVVSAIGYVISLKKLTLRYNSYSIVTYQSVIAALLMLPVFMATERITPSMLTAEALAPILKLTTFASIIAFLLYAYSLRHFSIAKINVFLNLIPVFTAIAAYFLQGDKFSAINLAGIAVTLAGLYVSQVTLSARNASPVKH